MRPRQYLVDIPAVLVAVLLAFQMCRMTVGAEVEEEEQAARDWLEQLYGVVERHYFEWISASWNFNVNITEENNQKLVSIHQQIRSLCGSGGLRPYFHYCCALRCVATGERNRNTTIGVSALCVIN